MRERVSERERVCVCERERQRGREVRRERGEGRQRGRGRDAAGERKRGRGRGRVSSTRGGLTSKLGTCHLMSECGVRYTSHCQQHTISRHRHTSGRLASRLASQPVSCQQGRSCNINASTRGVRHAPLPSSAQSLSLSAHSLPSSQHSVDTT